MSPQPMCEGSSVQPVLGCSGVESLLPSESNRRGSFSCSVLARHCTDSTQCSICPYEGWVPCSELIPPPRVSGPRLVSLLLLGMSVWWLAPCSSRLPHMSGWSDLFETVRSNLDGVFPFPKCLSRHEFGSPDCVEVFSPCPTGSLDGSLSLGLLSLSWNLVKLLPR